MKELEIKTNLKSRFKPNHDRHERGRYGLKTNKVLVKSMKSSVSRIPEEKTLKIVGNRNPVTHVTSYGSSENVVLGYQIGEQRINPSISSNNPINSKVAGDFKGIAGGVRAVYRHVKRSDLFSFRVTKDPSGKIIELLASPDTISYAREFFKLASLLDNSQATYLPIMMATPVSVVLSEVPSRVKNADGSYGYYMYEDISIPADKLAEVFSVNARMLNIYLIIMMADIDISSIAGLMYSFVDVIFKKGPILKQKFFEVRDNLDIWMNYMSRSAIVKPVSLFISKLLGKKLVSENFWNASLSKLFGMHAEFDGYSGEITQTYISRTRIKSYTYSLSGNQQILGSIFDKIPTSVVLKNGKRYYPWASSLRYYNVSESGVSSSSAITAFNFIGANIWTNSSETHQKPLLKLVIDGNVDTAAEIVKTWVDNLVENIIPRIQNNYASLESLHYALNGGGGALGFTAPFWNVDNLYPSENIEYNTYFDAISFSSISPRVTSIPQSPEYVYSLRSQTIFDEKIGLVTRTPINYDGQTPDILSKDMYYRNIPMNVWNDVFFKNYASGTHEAMMVLYNRRLDAYPRHFDASNMINYSNDYELVINWLRRKIYDVNYSIIPNSSITLDIRSNNFYLYMDATTTTQVNVAAASNFGAESSPMNKVSSDMLIR